MAAPKLQLLSRTLYDTDGSTTVWDFNFSGGYILSDHIKAYSDTADGVRTTIVVTPAMLIGPWQLQITPAIPAGSVLTIYRSTPKDQPMVDFVDRGTVSEVALDTVARQAIFVAAEASDDVATANIDVAINAADRASDSATAAAGSASAAAASATSLSNFKAVWLGAAASDPTVDGNGNPLGAGATYLNTSSGFTRVYNGSAWVTNYVPSTTFVAQTSATGAASIPAGTTAQRPAPTFGMQRANSTTHAMEWWNGTAWVPMGGGATGGGNDQIFWKNGKTVTTSHTILSTENAGSFGPIAVADGVSVTVNDGGTWTVV